MFSSENTRLLFHQLPTETQVLYAELENKLAKRGSMLYVEQVIAAGSISEVIIRIAENFKLPVHEADFTHGD